MIHTERISAWLQEPHHLQEIAPEAIQHLADEYPFFAPPHYFLLVSGRQEAGRMAMLQQLNPVNPVMLGNFLRAAASVPEALATETTIPAIVEQPEVTPAAEAIPAAVATASKPEAENAQEMAAAEEELLILPLSGEDYFLQQGIEVSNDIADFTEMAVADDDALQEQSLMVVMSFAEWLKYISSSSKKAKEEEEDKKALKAMWQQQKLAAAMEEEGDEIPEQVFEMAVNSIARKEELVSESLANVYAKQGKVEKAIEMYQKLSLQNPEKNAYFASKIEKLQKEI